MHVVPAVFEGVMHFGDDDEAVPVHTAPVSKFTLCSEHTQSPPTPIRAAFATHDPAQSSRDGRQADSRCAHVSLAHWNDEAQAPPFATVPTNASPQASLPVVAAVPIAVRVQVEP